jgi:hypothetical protein
MYNRYSDESYLSPRIAAWIKYLTRRGGPFKSKKDLATTMCGPASDVSNYANKTPGREPGLVFFARLQRAVWNKCKIRADVLLNEDPPIADSETTEKNQRLGSSEDSDAKSPVAKSA